MRGIGKMTAAWALLSLLAVGRARAVNTSNYWIGTTGGDYTNTANWSAGAAPLVDQFVFFTNGVNQTITFSASVTNKSASIFDSSLTVDLNGYQWRNIGVGFVGEHGNALGTNGGAPMTLHFSASQAQQVTGGNQAVFGNTFYLTESVAGPTTVLIDKALGYPVRVSYGGGYGTVNGAALVVDGIGSEFNISAGNQGALLCPVLITNGALLSANGSLVVSYSSYSTTTVVNASVSAGGAVIGQQNGRGWMLLSDGSFWYSGGTLVLGGAGVAEGVMLLDNSDMVAQIVNLASTASNRGELQLLNGSTAVISNRIVVGAFTTKTNKLVLNNGTIALGGGATPGVLTNRGMMRAAGTILGQGASPALVRNERSLEIGSSIGTLVLSNANLELAAGSQTLFELSETSLDQIILNGGSASILGSNLYTIVGNTPTPGVKWGLGAYDFVVGENVTWNPQYDDITNVLAGYSLVQGLDYNFGLVNLGNGLQALRLEFVPEPSTALLLLGGGLLLWKVRRRRLAAP